VHSIKLNPTRMMAVISPIPRFPVEIIERIIDFVVELPYDYDDFVSSDLYVVWKACALTCRAMRARSQYWLFRRIKLSTQSQADSLMRVLRRNPKVAQYTQSLVIEGPQLEVTEHEWSWISWIPLLLAPRMMNLERLTLMGNIFSKCHPNLARALIAFKSIRRLDLWMVRFSSFGHCAWLIQAFPHLDHLNLSLFSWEPLPLDAPHPRPSLITRQEKSRLLHLDFWIGLDTVDRPDLNDFTRWLTRFQCNGTLRTLSLYVPHDHLIQTVLPCFPFIHSVYLLLVDGTSQVSGFESLAHLQTLHIQVADSFLVECIVSIVLSIPSRHLRSLTIYVKAEEKNGENRGSGQLADELDLYARLDDALCKPVLNGLTLRLCIYGADSDKVVVQWRQRLCALLPKFCALARFRVESTLSKSPYMKWMKHRDGF